MANNIPELIQALFVSPTEELGNFAMVMQAATDLVSRAARDCDASGRPDSGTDPHLLVLLDFVNFGSFSFRDLSRSYQQDFLRCARKGQCKMTILGTAATREATEVQFPEARFNRDRATPYFQERLRELGMRADIPYSEFIQGLVDQQTNSVAQLIRDGVRIRPQNADARLHVWVRGQAEAVVSFVLLTSAGGATRWDEAGFRTTSPPVVHTLRNFINTLFWSPLGGLEEPAQHGPAASRGGPEAPRAQPTDNG
jgi:hypothetical protein